MAKKTRKKQPTSKKSSAPSRKKAAKRYTPGRLGGNTDGFEGIQEAVAVQGKILASHDEAAKKRLRAALNKALDERK